MFDYKFTKHNDMRCKSVATVFSSGASKSGKDVNMSNVESQTSDTPLPSLGLDCELLILLCNSMQAAITLTCMARNSLTLFEHIRK